MSRIEKLSGEEKVKIREALKETGMELPLGQLEKSLDLSKVKPDSLPTEKLVRMLLDGNPHVENNNKLIEVIKKRGKGAVSPLIEAIKDENFAGRGYAAWALAEVMKEANIKDDRALSALVASLKDRYSYLRMLSASSLSLLKDKRTVYGLVSNFDPHIHNFQDTLKIITGKTFHSKDEALSWWEKNKSEYPLQILP